MSELRLIKISLLAMALLAALPVYTHALPEGEKVQGPIVITSETLSADTKGNTAVFEGSVIAKTDDVSLHADRMTVHYTDDGDIVKIEVEGSVKLEKDDGVLTSERATYLAGPKKIIFSGNPMAVDGKNIITGSEIIYMIDEDRSIVHNSKVYIEQGKGR